MGLDTENDLVYFSRKSPQPLPALLSLVTTNYQVVTVWTGYFLHGRAMGEQGIQGI